MKHPSLCIDYLLTVLFFFFFGAITKLLTESLDRKRHLALFRMGSAKRLPYLFFPCNFSYVRISPRNKTVLTLLPDCCKIPMTYLVPVANYLT